MLINKIHGIRAVTPAMHKQRVREVARILRDEINESRAKKMARALQERAFQA